MSAGRRRRRSRRPSRGAGAAGGVPGDAGDRSYAFFLQPSVQNGTDFWPTVVDRTWLANSPDADAAALRPTQGATSMPWRVLYRVTDSERYLPPVSSGVAATPQITRLMAVPVLEPRRTSSSRSSGPDHPGRRRTRLTTSSRTPSSSHPRLPARAQARSGPQANTGFPIPPNNVIPFDLIKKCRIDYVVG